MRRALPPRRTAAAVAVALLGSLLSAVVTATPALAEEVYERPANGVFAVEGHGWGHGHGMSQWGAQGAASKGIDADTITATYYPGTAKATIASRPIRVLLSADEGRDTQVHAAPG
jgi:peptidoglycan hydrolase-like amidase